MASIYVTWNGLRLDVPGFCQALDIDPLIGPLGLLVGDDFVADGIEGETFRAKVRRSKPAVCSWLIRGQNDENGTAHPDNWSGLRDNSELIEATLMDATEDAPQTLTVTYPDAGTRSALAWCANLDLVGHDGDRLGIARRLIVDIRVPSTRLV